MRARGRGRARRRRASRDRLFEQQGRLRRRAERPRAVERTGRADGARTLRADPLQLIRYSGCGERLVGEEGEQAFGAGRLVEADGAGQLVSRAVERGALGAAVRVVDGGAAGAVDGSDEDEAVAARLDDETQLVAGRQLRAVGHREDAAVATRVEAQRRLAALDQDPLA